MEKKPESMFDKLGDLLRESLDSGFVVPERNPPDGTRESGAARADVSSADDGTKPQDSEARDGGRVDAEISGGTRAESGGRRGGAEARDGGRVDAGISGGTRGRGARSDSRRPSSGLGGAEFRAGIPPRSRAADAEAKPFSFRMFAGGGDGVVRPAQIYRPLRIPGPVLDALAGIGIPEGADSEAAKRIYREKLQHFHPDKWLGTPYVAQAEEMTRRLIAWWAVVEKWLGGEPA